MRTALELETTELAVKRLDEHDETVLYEALDTERTAASFEEFVTIGHDLHDVLAEIPQNPVLTLLSLVFTRLTRMHQGVPPGRSRPSAADVQRSHDAIVQAIVQRDAELALHRMRRHLDALMVWVQ